jgi:hypothetical protein
MSNDPSNRDLAGFQLRSSSDAARPSAAELTARYARIKRRQRILAAIGVVLLILLYLFLRYVLPWIGAGRRPGRLSQARPAVLLNLRQGVASRESERTIA